MSTFDNRKYNNSIISLAEETPSELTCLHKCRTTPGCKAYVFYTHAYYKFFWRGYCIGLKEKGKDFKENGVVSGYRMRNTCSSVSRVTSGNSLSKAIMT
jgi:hypothetical protein